MKYKLRRLNKKEIEKKAKEKRMKNKKENFKELFFKRLIKTINERNKEQKLIILKETLIDKNNKKSQEIYQIIERLKLIQNLKDFKENYFFKSFNPKKILLKINFHDKSTIVDVFNNYLDAAFRKNNINLKDIETYAEVISKVISGKIKYKELHKNWKEPITDYDINDPKTKYFVIKDLLYELKRQFKLKMTQEKISLLTAHLYVAIFGLNEFKNLLKIVNDPILHGALHWYNNSYKENAANIEFDKELINLAYESGLHVRR